MGKKSSYILLADYAKSAGLSLEEARELVSREENKKFFKVANGKELISREIDKQTPPAPAPTLKEEAVEESKEEQPATASASAEEAKTSAEEAKTSAEQEEILRLRKEVEELKEQIRNKDTQIADFALRFANLADQAQLIAGQAQVLQAQEQKMLEAPAGEHTEKKGFFRKLFSK